MNIHEHQAKDILREFGAPVSDGVVINNLDEIDQKISQLKSKQFVLKAQIHAGGRGKAGGIKLIKDLRELKLEAKKMMGKILITIMSDSLAEKQTILFQVFSSVRLQAR